MRRTWNWWKTFDPAKIFDHGKATNLMLPAYHRTATEKRRRPTARASLTPRALATPKPPSLRWVEWETSPAEASSNSTFIDSRSGSTCAEGSKRCCRVVDRSWRFYVKFTCISSQANKNRCFWCTEADVAIFMSQHSKWENDQAMKFGVQILQKAPKIKTQLRGFPWFREWEPVFRSFCGLFGWQSWCLRSFCHFVMTVTILECICHHVVTLGLGWFSSLKPHIFGPIAGHRCSHCQARQLHPNEVVGLGRKRGWKSRPQGLLEDEWSF